MSKIDILWKEEYYDCDHAGCGGGETYFIKISVDGEEVAWLDEGGCFGSDLYSNTGAVERILKELGHEVTIRNG